MTRIAATLLSAVTVFAMGACKPKEAPAPAEEPPPPKPAPAKPVAAPSGSPSQVFWGDTHLHTSYSPDAYLMQNRSADPDTAYRYAKGYPVVHPYHKARIQIHTPLDFLVVSDHGEFMGVLPKLLQGDPLVADTKTGKRYRKLAAQGKEIEVFADLIAQVNGVIPPRPDLNNEAVNRTVWDEIMEAADRHNEPGKFTAFMGWEWSSTPQGANLHRVVVMRGGKKNGEHFLPYTAFDSSDPEDLWTWLEETSKRASTDFLAIPHNSNISKGLMFSLADSDGKAVTPEYAQLRMRWEPVVEVTQIKGDSETHPTLSPNDEFADYETYDHLISVEGTKEKTMFSDAFLGALSEADRKFIEENMERVGKNGDYARTALLRGLVIEDRIGANPYKFAMIGSTDSHTAMSSAEENNFHGKMAIDSTPGTKKEEIIPGTPGWDMGAAGMAAVWATENTREALFDAMRRKEVYASTGPRIELRFFGGYDFAAGDAGAGDVAGAGYTKGVPMGADLAKAPEGKAPTFLVRAVRDPKSANLDRIQIVKGWLGDDALPQEKVYDVALSDGRTLGADGKAPPVGNTVDIRTGNWTNEIGDPELAAVWSDPDFDAGKRAFYYVRVLEIPTPRSTLFDAIALGIDVKETGNPATIQERAYSSPIWYTP